MFEVGSIYSLETDLWLFRQVGSKHEFLGYIFDYYKCIKRTNKTATFVYIKKHDEEPEPKPITRKIRLWDGEENVNLNPKSSKGHLFAKNKK